MELQEVSQALQSHEDWILEQRRQGSYYALETLERVTRLKSQLTDQIPALTKYGPLDSRATTDLICGGRSEREPVGRSEREPLRGGLEFRGVDPLS